MKNIFIILFTAAALNLSAQVQANGTVGSNATETSAFLNASGALFSSSDGFSTDGSGNKGKGLAFPRTDLTSFTFTTLLGSDFPTYADGLIVYNVNTGSTPTSGSGIGNQTVEPGFYYFSNPGSQFDTNNGQWLPLGRAAAKFTVGTTETETNAIIGTDGAEYAIRVTGTADGTNTFLAISDSDWDLDTVKQLRKCLIYEGDTLIMTAMSTFEGGANNRIVTGNGMTNLLLRNTAADAYTAECYYTKN